MAQIDKKRIAKNTLALYVRMFFVMSVTIFSSRIVLEKLGVTDFGIYSAVGGVVAMLSFLNGTLSISTSRFLTFELGTGNFDKLKTTFSTAFYSHLILAIIVATILIAGGTWFVLNKLIIPEESKLPALYTFYISIFTVIIAITQVPYTSVIIAHERMNIYAYLGIIETIAKLGIAYAISLAPINKLVWYALMIAAVQLLIAVMYRIFCIRSYKESHLMRKFDKSIFKQMLGFSGWSFIANISQVLSTQGLIVLINMFFAPAVAAAQAVANQISNAIMQFINNFWLAANPQITKLYAAKEYEMSQKLTLQATVFAFDLILLIGLPLIMLMKPLIYLWLVDVPPFAVVFAQFIIATQIISIFNITFWTPIVASGQLKENSYAALIFGIGLIVVLFFLLKSGKSPMWVQYVFITQAACFAIIVKPWILWKKIGYSLKDIAKCYLNCLKSAILPVLVCIVLSQTVSYQDSYTKSILVASIVAISVIISSFIWMEPAMRKKITKKISAKLHV